MKKALHFIIVPTIILFTSCGSKQSVNEGYYFESFDNLKMWCPDAQLTWEKARSGSFSAFTDSTHEFSQTFQMDFTHAQLKGYKNVKVKAWCCLAKIGGKANFVLTVDGPQKTVSYQSLDFDDFIEEANDWTEVNTYLKLPESTPKDSKIKIYLWSPQKEKAFLDDIEIQFSK